MMPAGMLVRPVGGRAGLAFVHGVVSHPGTLVCEMVYDPFQTLTLIVVGSRLRARDYLKVEVSQPRVPRSDDTGEPQDATTLSRTIGESLREQWPNFRRLYVYANLHRH